MCGFFDAIPRMQGATVVDGTWFISDDDLTTGRSFSFFAPAHSRGNRFVLNFLVFDVAPGGALTFVGTTNQAGNVNSPVSPPSESTLSNFVGTLGGGMSAVFTYDNDDQSLGTGIHHRSVSAQRFGP